jgi:Spy/CpxP family protein refolding chaperone
MDNAAKSKWRMRIAALIIFVLGFSAGALAYNAYRAWSRNRVEAGRNGFDQMLDRLQLTAEQKAQVHQILAETREQLQALRKESEPRVNEIRQRTDERLQKVLTPEQWTQFQQKRDEMRRRRAARMP